VKKISMLWKVIIAIVLAVIVGNQTGQTAQIFGVPYFHIFDIVGELFLNSLTLLVVPLITSAIISGLGQMSGQQSFKSLGIKTFGFYVLTIGLAVLVGVLFVNIIKPGTFLREATVSLTSPVDLKVTSQKDALTGVLFKLVPKNIIEAGSSGNMLGIIFFSLLFGFAMMKIEHSFHQTLLNFWKGLFSTLMRMTHMVMQLMPIGVFCLVAKVIATQGISTLGNLAYFFLTVFLGLATFCFIILPALLKFSGLDPINHMKAMMPALFTAFSTSSSAATLPVTIECVEKGAGVSNRVCSFVVPLGTSMNMAGSALYECIAVLFIAQAYGIHLTISHQIIIAVLSLITSMGVAGIPSGSLVAIIIILNSLGLPAEGIALILPIDRLLDMLRTTANVYSDTACAVLVAKSEGEEVLKNVHVE
jgi:proton glutamate symport protein